MSPPEHPRDRAQRYLAMAETTPDPHIANGLRLLAAAYLEKAAKEGEQQQGTKLPEHGDDATS